MTLRSTLRALALASLASISAGPLGAQDPVPTGVELPALSDDPASLRTVERPDRVRVERDPVLEREVVAGAEGARESDVLRHALVRLEASDRGASFVRVASGIGVMASASASYAVDAEHADLTLREQHLAWCRANQLAKRELVALVEGLSIESTRSLERETRTVDGTERSLVDRTESDRDRIARVTGGFLRGAVTYDVDDDPGRGRVRVAVVSTPGTRSRLSARGGTELGSDSLATGLALVRAELLQGVVPPVGSRFLRVPSTGERAWVGFGSALVREAADPVLVARLRAAAEEQALVRADAALVALLTGERLDSTQRVDERFDASWREYDRLVAEVDGAPAASRSFRTTDEAVLRTVVEGRLPAGVETVSLVSADGRWVHAVRVYREGAVAALAPGRGASLAACDPGADLEGVAWVQVRGSGALRVEAIDDALALAVGMVRGVAVQGRWRDEQAYRESLGRVAGSARDDVLVGQELAVDIELETRGQIRSYRLLGERAVAPDAPEFARGHRYEVSLCVEVFDFDPERPRRSPVLAVLPLRTGEAELDVLGQARPAAAAARDVERALGTGLAAAAGFRLSSRRYDTELDGELDRIERGVQQGRMPLAELARVGHELGADYVLVGTLESLHHRRWREWIAIRGVHEDREELAIDVECELVDVATRETVCSASFARVWGTFELVDLASDELGLDGVALASRRATGALVEQVARCFRERTGSGDAAALPRVLRVWPDKERHAIALDGGVAVGQRYDLFRSVPAGDGSARRVEEWVATLRVSRVGAGGEAYAEVEVGDAAEIAPGDYCRPAR